MTIKSLSNPAGQPMIAVANDDPRWNFEAATHFEQTTYKGQKAVRVVWEYRDDPLVDGAFNPLQGVDFGDGIIEVDMAKGPFVGVGFRGQPDGRYELIYFRPPWQANNWKAIQYGNVGNPNGMPRYLVESRQDFCHTDAAVPAEDWFHVKLVITGPRLEVYLNEALVHVIPALLQAEQRGSIGLWAWDGYLTNFRYARY